jgi:hypothetical protein
VKDAVSPARGWAGREGARNAIYFARRVTEINNRLGVIVKRRREAPPFDLVELLIVEADGRGEIGLLMKPGRAGD